MSGGPAHPYTGGYQTRNRGRTGRAADRRSAGRCRAARRLRPRAGKPRAALGSRRPGDAGPDWNHPALKGGAGELAPPIGVENLRPAVPGKRLFESLETEIHLHGNRNAPRQNPPAGPVHHGRQVDEAARHRNVRDVHGPHLVGPHHRKTTQKIRIDLVSICGFRGIRPAIQRLDAHSPHHGCDLLPPDRDALAAQQIAQHPAAREGVAQVQFVDPPHGGEIGGRHRARFVIEAAAAKPEHPRLACQRQLMVPVDHRFALSRPALPSAPAKKSFSNVRACPQLSQMVAATRWRAARKLRAVLS